MQTPSHQRCDIAKRGCDVQSVESTWRYLEYLFSSKNLAAKIARKRGDMLTQGAQDSRGCSKES